MYQKELHRTALVNPLEANEQSILSPELPTKPSPTKHPESEPLRGFLSPSDDRVKSRAPPIEEAIVSHLLENELVVRFMNRALSADRRDDRIEEHLRPYIKILGQEIRKRATEPPGLVVARSMLRHATFIASAMIKKLRQKYPHTTLAAEGPQNAALEPGILPHYQLYDYPEHSDYDYDITDHLSEDEYRQEQLMSTLKTVQQFVASGDPLNIFIYLLSRMIYPSTLSLARAEMKVSYDKTTSPRSERLNAKFRLPREMLAHIMWETDQIMDQLPHLITVTSCGKDFFASSIMAYIQSRWPEAGPVLLEALCLTDPVHVPGSVDHMRRGEYDSLHDILAISKSVEDSHLTVSVHGTRRLVHDVGGVLAWLTEICRPGETHGVLSSRVLFSAIAPGEFQIVTLPLQQINPGSYECWMPLFTGTVVASDFHVPERGQEVGIELPFDLMTSIMGPLYPMSYDGGIYFRAHSRLLYPTHAVSDPDMTIQWHFESSSDGGALNLSLPKALQQGRDGPLTAQQFVHARTFLGYCRESFVSLGTEAHTPTHNDICNSGLDDETGDVGVEMPKEVTVGTGGAGFITLQASFPIIKTKAMIEASIPKHDFDDSIREAERQPVILYDSKVHRAWMVPISCLLVHMVQYWSASRGIPIDTGLFAPVEPDSGSAARKLLDDKWNLIVRKATDPDKDPDKTVRALVMGFWDNLRQKRSQELAGQWHTQNSITLSPEKLYGWEYDHIVKGSQTIRKQLPLKANWAALTTECLVLFGQGFGEVVQPTAGTGMCNRWSPARQATRHLTATMTCLHSLARERGGHAEVFDSYRLTNKHYWHYHTPETFMDCTHGKNKRCPKTLQWLHDTAKAQNSLCPPSYGAIVFGRKKQLEKKRTQNGHSITSASSQSDKGPRSKRAMIRAWTERTMKASVLSASFQTSPSGTSPGVSLITSTSDESSCDSD